MNTENSKTSEPHRFKLDLTDKLNLKNPNKNMVLANLSIHYTWKNIKSEYNNNKFEISATTWNGNFDLSDAEGNDQVSIDSAKKYFLARVEIENYDIKIDGENFYDQPINDSVKQYDEIRKISTGQGDDYTTGYLLDFVYFEKNYRLIVAN